MERLGVRVARLVMVLLLVLLGVGGCGDDAATSALDADRARDVLLTENDFGGFYLGNDDRTPVDREDTRLVPCEGDRLVPYFDGPGYSTVLDRDDDFIFVHQEVSVSSTEAAKERFAEASEAFGCLEGFARDEIESDADEVLALKESDTQLEEGLRDWLLYLREENVLMVLYFDADNPLEPGEVEWVVDVALRKAKALAAGAPWSGSGASSPP